MTRFNQDLCAGWMEWGAWSDCQITETVPTTDLELLGQDPDLKYDIWRRYKTRSCNTGDGTCLDSPTLDRTEQITEDCCKIIYLKK